jgi:TRAP-type transport system small permease protein
MGVLQSVERANTILDRWLMVITGTALVFATVLCFMGVILRYGFGISYEWNEELCRYSMIIIVYLWAGAMIRSKQHIYFSLWSDTLKGKKQDAHRFATSLITAILGIPLIVWGFQLTANTYDNQLRTMSLLFPLWPAYAILPIGIALIEIQAIFDIIRLSSILFSGSPRVSNS